MTTKRTSLQADLEATLDAKRREFEQRLAAISRDRGNGLEKDSKEQATQLENRDVLDGLACEAERELVKVRAALKRLREGAYGSCDACGGQIAVARLAAYPQARHCLACATDAEPVLAGRTAV